ncbi:MAG: type II methionyl aminopeptidase [Candidatus Jordarchaeum sp.]|uniref:type II methionyl aminopeptidase n=1 Tax=Candidatus Jordarchaeum sp. TaxID=2823881 RepID=UPI00404A541E
MLDDDALNNYRTAGSIAAKIRGEAKKIVKEGTPLIKICETLEKKIISDGGKPAFPLNISVNDVAAHYTSPPDDTTRIPSKALVKVDIGVHVNGFIADTASTVSVGKVGLELIKASELALENALKFIKHGVKSSQIGEIIEKTIKEFGFKPISNLTGHLLDQYNLHAGKSIPNVKTIIGFTLKEGEVYAMEPFSTTGAGIVEDSKYSYIFRLASQKTSDQFLSYITHQFRTLPFASRWLSPKFSKKRVQEFIKKYVLTGTIQAYPVLVERERGVVSQAEHTFIVKKNGCEVTSA